jgi:hypothetical protein
MKRAFLCAVVVTCLLTTVFILRGSVPVVSTGQWSAAADMLDSRDSAASVLLANGDTLITGGANSAGSLQTSDLYHSDGTLGAAAPMQVARSRHSATLLQDGRVLVAGGDTGAGVATNSAEIYDPSSDSWTSAGPLITARLGHRAILLDDGTVAIVGGESNGSPVSTIEIYDPGSNSFSQGPSLNISRKNAAAAKLSDGRVLITGGFGTDASGSSVALNSAEIFDPKSGAVSAAAGMNVARGNHTAIKVLDGIVVVAGGSDGQNDLNSIETYNLATDSWVLSPATLSVPRSGHAATLLSNNNSVLITSGTSGSTAVQTADIYQPWNDAVVSGGTMNAVRLNGTGSAFGLEGLYLAAGGSGASSTELYRFPTIKTDKPDYSPGQPVLMTGTGYQPGETVNLNLKQDDGDPNTDTPVTADAAGNISYQSFAPDVGDIGTHFHLTATGQTSGFQAQTSFTDANFNVKASPTTATFTLTYQLFSSNNCTTGGTGTQTLPITGNNGVNIPNFGNTNSVTLQAPTLSNQGTAFSSWSGTASFTGTNPICVTVSGNPDFVATYGTVIAAPTLNTISPNSGDLGQTLTNVILTGTNFANDATVAVAGTGVTLGTVTVNSTTQITISSITIATTATTLGGHSITVTNPVPTGFTGGGSSSQTFTVNKRTTTASVACNPTTVPVGTATSCTATITDNDSGTTVTPAGTVSFTSSGTGSFSPASCTLTGTGATASCSSSYTPSAVGSGTHSVTGSYGGDTAHGTSSGNTNVTVTRATVTATVTANNKIYDATTTATQSTCTLSGVLAADTGNVTCSAGTLTFTDKNVGTGKTVNVSGITLSGSAAGNYQLSSTTATTTANITARPLTVTAATNTKTYDGTTSAAATPAITSGTLQGGDTANFTESYDNKNVGTGKTLTPSGSANDGNGGNNYSYTFVNNTTGVISARTLHVTATGVNKTYDGTTAATVTLSDDRLSGDSFTDGFSSATFLDKNVGTGKTVTVSGISISGTDAGNYTLASTTATTTANITSRSLTVTATGVNKVYDGTATATVTLADNRVAGDSLTDNFTSASFADKNVGLNKTVSVSGISISGTDAGNYSLSNTTATTTANITARALHVTAAGGNKVYDGTTAATVTLSDDRISGDSFADSYTSATFSDKNVGTGKTVTVTGISISGADAGNYQLASTTTTTTANITARTLHVTASGVNKVYDGTTAATVTLSDDRISGDVFNDSFTSATFTDKNVGTAKPVSVSGISISGTDAGNYNPANTTATTTANITPRTLHVSATGADKIYDGTTTATVTLSDDRVGGDVVTDGYASASFADKNVGTNKTVTVSGISISGTDAGNYNLAAVTATTTANITARTLHVTAAGVNKVYDGTTTASVTLSDDRIAGDVFTDSFTTASFADKNAGNGKTVTVSGVAISGTDAGNYQLASTTITTTANITARPLHITATGINKIYDGTTAATVSLSDDRIGGDAFTDGYLSASFADKNVGAAKPVTVSGISISGADAGNYTFNTTANTSADITPRALHITATGVNKVYDGTTAATVNLTDDRVAGDAFTDGYLSASFADKNVGVAKPVSVNGISISGPDAPNYTFNTSASTIADITPASLTITAVSASKTYGQTVVFLGTEFVATGLISPDSVNSVSLFSAGAAPTAAVGPYSIVPSGATGTGLSNYNITYTSGLLTVNPAGLTITAKDQTKTFGTTFTFTGAEFVATGLLNSDSVTSVTLTSPGADPGATVAGSPYPIMPSAAVGSGLANYTISYVNGSLTVTPASSITTLSSSLNPSTYGDAVTFTATVSPLPPSSGTPTGTVSFSDGAITLASNVPLSAGQASFTTSALNASVPWSQLSPGGVSIPDSMCGPSVLSDGQGDLILYGGGADSCATNTNGVFVLSHANGQGGPPAWTQLSPTGSAPPGTHNQMAAYDPNTNTLMVFGGCEGGCFPLQSNVYILSHANGQGGTPNWSLLSTTGGPPSARISAAMTYDPNSNRLILFGGQNGGGSDCGTFSDTWVLTNANGSGGTPTWTQLSPAGGPPAGQYGPASFYDVANKRLIVAGGNGVIGSCKVTNAVWALSNADGTTGTPAWTNLIPEDAPGAPSGFSFVPGTYDPANNRALLVSGTAVWQINNANGLNGTASWTLVAPGSGPSTATSYGIINDPATNTLTSIYNNNETWILPWTHVITATYSGDSNFDATSADPASKAFGVGQWVNQKSVTATVTANSKIYDGTTTATQDTCTLSGVLPADSANVTCSASTLNFVDKNAGAGKLVNVSGISISGSAAANYQLGSTTATTTADITPRSLTITATGVNKVYDGNTTATVTLSDNRVSGDVFTDSYTTASFADKNVGTTKPISVTGISISGTDAGNYTFNTTASTTADITARALTIIATGISKVYDGTSMATVTLSDNRVSGDVFTDSYASASFNDKNAGTAKPVSVTGISISGTDAPNYTFNTTASTTADITPRPLTITATGVNKVYDGTTTATVTLSDNRISGDIFTDAYTSATFNNKNAGTAKPVSVIGISISGTDAPNYTFNTTASTTADITPRPLTITATGVNKVYDGTTTATVTLADNRISGDVFTDAYLSASFADKNAGTAKPISVTGISISGTDAPNYTFNTTASATADITPRPLTITAMGVNKVYDGTTAATVTLSDNRVSGDIFIDSYISAVFNNKNAGTAKPVSVIGISISGTDALNYTFNTTASTTADIAPRPLAITAAGMNKVYDGTTTATVTLSDNRVSGDVFTDSYSTASFADKNAGTAKPISVTGISISGTDAPNYTFNTTASAIADITPRPLTVTATGVNKVYDGTTAAAVVLADNRISGDLLSDAYTSASFADKNVGTNKTISVSGISISGTDAGNYSLSSTTATTTANITARTLHVTATGVTKIYDGTTTATVTLSDDRISGDVLTDSYTSASFADKNVGTSKAVAVMGISISGTDAGNYTLNGITTATTTANITPRTLDVTAVAANKIYDGTTTASVTLSDDRVSGDVFADSFSSAAFSDKNVGNGKAVTVSGIAIAGSDAGNYQLASTTVVTTANITTRPLVIMATGMNKVYDGNTTATVTLSDNRVSGDVFTDSYTSASFADKNAGTAKAVSVSGINISGTDAPNYSFNTTASTTADITARSLIITATGMNKVYDGTTTATVTLSDNRVSGDVFTDSYSSAAFADKNVGTAKLVSVSGISISGTDAGNYTSNTTASTTANITARILTITATGVNKVYDSTTTATVTLSDNRVSGDVFTDSYTSASFADSSIGTAKPVSVSGISISGTDAGNYTFNTTATTTANITPAALTITANSRTKTYGQLVTFAGTEFTTSGLQGTDSVNTVTLASAGAALGATVAGSPYSIVPSAAVGTGLSNYNINYVNGTLTVSPAALTITAKNQTKTYGTTFTFSGTEFTASGLLNGDTLTSVTLTSAGAAATATVTAPGPNYVITASAAAGSGLGNYSIIYVSGTLTVTPAALTITANSRTKILGQTVTFAGTEFTTAGLVNGDTVTSVSLSSAGAPATAAVGPYPIVPTAAVGTGLGNYSIMYVNGTLTVLYAAAGGICDGDLGHTILQPINADGSSTFKQGSTVPAKFRVCDVNGNSIGTPGVVTAFNLVSIISGTATQTVDETVVSTTPDTTFRWDPTAQQWIFNISTKPLSAHATYIYLITLNDGSTISFRYGLPK